MSGWVLLGESSQTYGFVTSALRGWTQKDPVAALTWLEDHAGELPEPTVSLWRSHALSQAFAADPDFAVGKALELERGQLLQLSEQLAKAGKTPQDKLEILRAVGDRLEALPADPNEMANFSETASTGQLLRSSLLTGLGHSLNQRSFESAQELLESANLEPTELAVVAYGAFERMKDPAAWLSWIHENLAENARNPLIPGIVGLWARGDFRATAKWIGEQPQGALRERATYGFAEAVSGTEPEAAAEWALTLPASERRMQLLQKIHQDWQGQDAEAAATFARQNGLEVE